MSDNVQNQLSQSESPQGGSPIKSSSFLSSLGNVLGIVSNPLAGLLNTGLGFLSSSIQKDDARKQWERENEYNLPKNQIQRLKDAGLNPALMYQNGASGLLSAQSPELSKSGQPQLQGLDPLTMAQVQKLNAETRNIEKNTDLQGSELDLNKQKVLNLRQEIRESEQSINESAARIRNLDEDSQKKEAERINIKFEQVMRGKEWKDAHNKINAEIRRLNAGSQLDERQFKEMLQTFILRLTGLKLNNNLTQKETQHYSKLIDKLGVEIVEGKQQLMINMPAYYQGKAVWKMQKGNGVADKVGSVMYDGIGSVLTLIKGFISF